MNVKSRGSAIAKLINLGRIRFIESGYLSTLLLSTLLLPEQVAGLLDPSLNKLESVLVTIISTHLYSKGE
jgi:hypothetical protein